MDFDEAIDADLERAIALSLQEATQPKRPPALVDLDEDDDDDSGDEEARFQAELQRAIEASKAEVAAQGSTSKRATINQGPSSNVDGPAVLTGRAQMEQERLERIKRRKREAGLDEDEEKSAAEPPAKRQHISSSSGLRTNSKPYPVPSSSSTSSRAPITQNIPTSEQMFWDGEMRQTANMHAHPRKDGKPTIKLTEIFGKKSDISFAIMASYSTMLSWIYEFFDPTVPVIIVNQPDESGQAGMRNIFPNWIRTTPTLQKGRGCMHMKFMLLFYKTGRLRVVISTANLVDFDYRDIENTVWLQDVPLRSSPIPHDPNEIEDFPAVFQQVLQALHVHPALTTLLNTDHPNLPIKSINDLRMRWDWSKVKAHLVPSIAGRHQGWPDVIKTGHTRLMKAVLNMDLPQNKGKGKELVLECQGSSLGQYTTQWMNEFYCSARGVSAGTWLDEPKSRRTKLPWPAIKVVFPSLKTVRESVLGERGGGTIFCRRNQWKAENFPKQLFYDSKSKAGGVLMHSKMIIATFRDASTGKGQHSRDSDFDSDTEDDDIEVIESPVGWAYVGSHNFTPSAWGNLSGSAFNPILNITNYELGVVFPLEDEKAVKDTACWQRPARKYVLGEDLPWMQEESLYVPK